MATAEFAVVIPAVIAVLVLCIYAVFAGVNQLRCVDAARLAARAAARGESSSVIERVAREAGPPNAHVSVTTAGDMVEVRIRAPAGPHLGGLEPPVLSASSVARLESAAGER